MDAKVGTEIFQKAVKTYLKDQTILLNTHHLHFAKQCDNIILMNEGRIVAEGNYEELFAKYPHIFDKILKENEDEKK